MNEEVGAAAARVATHAKTLLDGAAPHQQELARDLACVAEAATAGHGEHAMKLANLQAHVDRVLNERDAARSDLAKVTARAVTVEASYDRQNAAHAEVLKERDAARTELRGLREQFEKLAADHADALKDVGTHKKALEEADRQVDAHEMTISAQEAEIAGLEVEKAKLGVASTKGPTHADLKAESKGHKK